MAGPDLALEGTGFLTEWGTVGNFGQGMKSVSSRKILGRVKCLQERESLVLDVEGMVRRGDRASGYPSEILGKLLLCFVSVFCHLYKQPHLPWYLAG